MKTCIRVVLCQRKKGLPSFLALSMKSLDALTKTSSNVSMSYLAFATFLPVLAASHVREWRQGSFINDLLFADGAPARLDRRIVGVGCIGVDQIARPGLVDPILRVVEPVRVGHRVEMVQVAEELIEAVHRRQVLVEITQVVLAELPGFIAHRLEGSGERDSLSREAHVGSGLPHSRQARADRQFAGNEVRPTRRAARLSVVVGEAHALRSQFVEVRRLAGHDALVVGANVEPADIVAHDDKDIGLLGCRLGLRRKREVEQRRHRHDRRQADQSRTAERCLAGSRQS